MSVFWTEIQFTKRTVPFRKLNSPMITTEKYTTLFVFLCAVFVMREINKNYDDGGHGVIEDR